MQLNKIQSKSDLPKDAEKLRDYAWDLVLYIQKLQEKLILLTKRQYGQSSEKTKKSDIVKIQKNLDLLLSEATSLNEDLKNEESVEIIKVKEHKRYRKHPGRNAIPDSITPIKVIHDIVESEKICDSCGKSKEIITEKEHIVVERIPAKYEVTKHIRPVYGCNKCKDGVSIAEPQNLPIPKGIAGPFLLCFIILSKYQFHLPLYRIQRQIFHESMIWFTRSTMVSWIRFLHKGIKRIHYELMSIYKNSYIKHADETHIKVRLIGKKGKHHNGRMWVGLGKENSKSPPVAVFYYNNSRSGDVANIFLEGSNRGDILMVDGCKSYNKPVKKYELYELNCMTHGRRKFKEARVIGYKKKFAQLILRKIGQLYRIERWADKSGLTPEQLGKLRKKFSIKILEKIYSLLLNPGFEVLPDRKIGQAINYMLNHWEFLIRYTENGEYPIDNNPVEQIIRTLTIGRKNWGCAGSESGAKWMAAWYSIITTCLLNNINPQEYIIDIIQRLPIRSENMSVKDLTPLQWLKSKKDNSAVIVDYPKN